MVANPVVASQLPEWIDKPFSTLGEILWGVVSMIMDYLPHTYGTSEMLALGLATSIGHPEWALSITVILIMVSGALVLNLIKRYGKIGMNITTTLGAIGLLAIVFYLLKGG